PAGTVSAAARRRCPGPGRGGTMPGMRQRVGSWPLGGPDTSILSIGSKGSILSIGSVGSILSIGSAGSVLSVGAVGSVLSIGSASSALAAYSVGSVARVGWGLGG